MQTHFDADSSVNGIAIIGMAGRFPKAQDLDAFWKNLAGGVDSVSLFTPEELIKAGVPPALLRRSNYVPAKNFLEDADLFDAGFFGYSSSEARLIDPQQRVFLELSWHALEHAGYDPAAFAGSIGVFAGCSAESYLWRNVFGNAEVRERVNIVQKFVNNFRDFLATRVSYKLSLTGPSLTLQTACSSSLVAVHVACQSLLNFECDMALAGGISITIPRKSGYLYVEGGIGSPDAKCHAFDARAQGCVAGNGGGTIVLKRLADAIQDRDSICAVILGSAINNDGSDKAGFTAPSVRGQAEVIAMAQASAGIDPETISYMEAHGTGTGLGDPIEIEALTRAFRSRTSKKSFCALGTVKTNIGHLDAAAGIAGLVKTCLAMQQKQIPASLHFEKPNPKIDFQQSPFFVNTQLRPWTCPDGIPRRAAISSFGMGGTNSHAILEEAPAYTASDLAHPYHVLILSGRSASVVERMRGNLLNCLLAQPGLPIADAAFTLQVGRRTFPHRLAMVVSSRENAIESLRGHCPDRTIERIERSENRPLVFSFPSESSAPWAADLYRSDLLFRQVVDKFWPAVVRQLPVLTPASDLSHPGLSSQARYFIAAFCLARLYTAIGAKPAGYEGRGCGSVIAACLQEDSRFEECLRSVVQNRMPDTAASLPAFEEEPVLLDFGEGAIRTADSGSMWWTLAELWAKGVRIDWNALHAGHERRRVPLPGYVFERERHWVDPDPRAEATIVAAPASEPVPASKPLVTAPPMSTVPAAHLSLFEEQLNIISRQIQILRGTSPTLPHPDGSSI